MAWVLPNSPFGKKSSDALVNEETDLETDDSTDDCTGFPIWSPILSHCIRVKTLQLQPAPPESHSALEFAVASTREGSPAISSPRRSLLSDRDAGLSDPEDTSDYQYFVGYIRFMQKEAFPFCELLDWKQSSESRLSNLVEIWFIEWSGFTRDVKMAVCQTAHHVR